MMNFLIDRLLPIDDGDYTNQTNCYRGSHAMVRSASGCKIQKFKSIFRPSSNVLYPEKRQGQDLWHEDIMAQLSCPAFEFLKSSVVYILRSTKYD